MPQYLLSVHTDYAADPPAPEVVEAMYADVDRFNHTMMDAGIWVFGGGLHQPSTATVVTAKGGDVIVTDGPYVEAKEHLGGFWIIDVPDLEAALRWASQATVACQGPVEVRPFQAD